MTVLILMDSDGFVWTGSDFQWPSDDTPPMTLTPEAALRTAFFLAKKYEGRPADGNIEIHLYTPSTQESQRFLCTDNACIWPRAELAFKRYTGVQLDRDTYLQWRDNPKQM
ncbi:hypothetical protein [Phytobacter diazotrophicus]|uniref:hypothetical protein n=1 Tax=Phytobacter diazotrophicus TaxID=395631 RepID=UPI002FFB3323